VWLNVLDIAHWIVLAAEVTAAPGHAIVLAVAERFGGSYLGARLSGQRHGDSLEVGILINTRGRTNSSCCMQDSPRGSSPPRSPRAGGDDARHHGHDQVAARIRDPDASADAGGKVLS
jgi:hypothetical protein